MLEHTLLIVDDEPANLAVLTHLLRPHYRVRAVNSGSRCLVAVQPLPRPDLILLDVMMPEMDGYEVLARLRADPATRDIPVLFVTALDDDVNEERGLALGAADYLTKPIRPGVLLAHPRFSAVLTPRYIDLLTKSAPLHDIGKVGVPDAILRKPGPLTPEEWAVMKTHAEIGAEAIERAEADIETPVEFLVLAKEIAHWHHEKWDGSGYPFGLAGEAIPLSARLMALADVFDALISVRVYKPAMSYEDARDVIVAGRGRHFDPDVADAFVAGYAEFVRIAERHRDPAA